jgi:asparagine synthase (glutamine-hydrolysing)
MAICGIAVKSHERLVHQHTVKGMVSSLVLRADWSQDFIDSPEASFAAATPQRSSSVWNSEALIVVCDADINNRNELRAQLKSAVAPNNLAGLLGQLYVEQGSGFLSLIRGVFSIAIWDQRSKTLLLAVDRFGVHPLCYSACASEIIFASHARGILASGRVTKEVNPSAIVAYLNYTAVPAPFSAYKGIQKLPPGSFLTWHEGTTRIAQYWDMEYTEDSNSSEQTLARELLERMEQAVFQNSYDVSLSELGCFLSGGTDSSSVVGLLTKVKKSAVHTFSIGFTEERFNELEYAHIATNQFGSVHAESRVGPEDAFRILPRIVDLYDEPFANSSVIPTYFCQVLAAERGRKVMLAGDGGDELFGGNEHYRTDRVYQLYQRLPKPLRRGLIDPLVSCIPANAPAIGKVRRYVQTSNTPNPDRYSRWMTLQYFPPEKILGPGTPFRNGHGDLLAVSRGHYQSARAQTELNRLLYLDVKMVLGDNDLPKVVRASELAGITVRFPFLDHPLAEFSGRIPSNLKLKGSQSRYLFKKATENLLPKAILEKKKHGFGLPMGMWLKNDPKIRGLAEDVLRDPRSCQRGFVRKDFIQHLFQSMDQDNTTFYGDVLYSFLMLELWYRKHMDGQPA